MANDYKLEQNTEGTISQWNEGNLKSLRLHEAQELINIAKMDPIRKHREWIDGIIILYGEGESKYSDGEIKEIESIKELIFLSLKLKQIIITKNNSAIFSSFNNITINYKNWDTLRKLIELFEQKVKKANDLHGLSTRNYDSMDDGL